MTIAYQIVLGAYVFFAGYLVGDIVAMRREEKHQNTLRRIRLGLE